MSSPNLSASIADMEPTAFDSLAAQQRVPSGIVLLEDRDLYPRQREQRDPLRVNATTRPELPQPERKKPRHLAHRGFHERQVFQLYETPGSSNSTNTAPLLFGAIRPGGAVDVFSSRYIGLPLNWVLIGFFDGAVASIVYQLLNEYLGYTGPQLNAVQALFNVPRLFKFLVGFMSDCIPINRQRRRPYMVIWWTILMVFMAATICFNRPSPYEHDGAIVDSDAADQGPRFVMMVFAGMFGHLMCTVASEGMMIEFADRESENARGRVVCLCVFSRFAGETVGGMATALAFNSADFGGTFAHAVSVRVVFATYALLAATRLAVTICLVHDEKTPMSSQRIATQLRRIWDVLQKPTVWQFTVVGFSIFIGLFFKPFEFVQVYRDRLGASSLTVQATAVMVSAGKGIAALLCMTILLHASWRKTTIVMNTVALLVTVPVDVMNVFDVLRSLALSLAKHQVAALLDGVVFVVYVLVAAEVSEPGYEAVSYGIITTAANIGIVFSAVCKNLAASHSSPTSLRPDTSEIQGHVMDVYLAKYTLRIVAMLFVWLWLPRQKRELRARLLHSAPRLVAPLVLFPLFALLFGVCVTSDLLAVFPSTSCLVFAGGRGC